MFWRLLIHNRHKWLPSQVISSNFAVMHPMKCWQKGGNYTLFHVCFSHAAGFDCDCPSLSFYLFTFVFNFPSWFLSFLFFSPRHLPSPSILWLSTLFISLQASSAAMPGNAGSTVPLRIRMKKNKPKKVESEMTELARVPRAPQIPQNEKSYHVQVNTGPDLGITLA